jgi:phosphopantothenoylcysteine decarboxylase/phosphopantothenate--cysteine ligase
VSLAAPEGVRVVKVESARDMLAACESELPADIAIFSAAVADWRVEEVAQEKMKKGGSGSPDLSLTENPDILGTVAQLDAKRPAVVVGFAAETQNILANARDKLQRKGCDLIVANDVSPASGVFGGDENTVHLISALGAESWPGMSKQAVAERLMTRIASLLAERERKAAE